MKMTLNEEIEYLQSGNWYDKVRTVLSTDEYLKLGWAIEDILEVLELFRSLAPEPQTNADRIRGMTDEELAEWAINKAPSIGKRYTDSRLGLLDWLQQPAEEDT